MKIRGLYTLIFFTASIGWANVLKPSQDSSSLRGKLTLSTGKATTLAVSATRKGYVHFNLDSLPQNPEAAEIVNARLRVYFPAAKKPGDIGIHTAAAGWNETATALEPGVSVMPVATFSASDVAAKQFLDVDVTSTIQAWRNTPATNFGFAFVASGLTNVLIGAKEGSGSGYPCELEIEIQRPNLIASGSITGPMLASGAALANIGSAATTESTPNTIVKRDAIGKITAAAFIGDGTALTNIPTSALIGTIPASQITGTILTGSAAPAPVGMALIPSGVFTMGNSVAADTDITDAAAVATTVSAFYMDVNEVTLSLWQSVYFWAKDNGYTDLPSGSGKGPNHPVHTVSWYACVKWCNARSEREGKTPVYYTDDAQTEIYRTGSVDVTNVQVNWTANGYRLPTEAEWEKAARGGLSGKRFPWGNTITQNLANYLGATGSYLYDLGPNGTNPTGSVGGTSPATSPVGSFAPNGYGLNDMAGNLWEWCWDWYATPYSGGTDPQGAPTGSGRMMRGGSWGSVAFVERCADRTERRAPSFTYNTIGLRAVVRFGQP